jgi:hypothetical protein
VISRGLVGALCGYFVLFGPLVLVPTTLGSRGISALHSGLVLTALPAGFAVAAVAAPAIIPPGLSEHRRAALGAMICSGTLVVALTVAPSPMTFVPLLALIGVGLGVFTPSNNSLVMGAIPPRAAASGGGLLNLTRGLGTALGVATVTLALHLGRDRLAVAVLLAGALVATFASLDRPARGATDPRARA